MSAHNDGSFVVWSTQGSAEPLEPPNTPYGPYPCKAITKIEWAHENGTAWTVFAGGMPRASYSDKFTVTVMKGEEKHTVFDLSSKVVDFKLVFAGGEGNNVPERCVQSWSKKWALGCVNSRSEAARTRDSRNLGPTLEPIFV